MNRNLYDKIRDEKESIELVIRSNNQDVNTHTVSELLKTRLYDNSQNKLVIICAFYEYMNDRVDGEYQFIKEEPWNNYYKRNISKYFTYDIINMHIDEIMNNPKLFKIIMNMCDENTIIYFYKLAKTQYIISQKNGSNKYDESFKKIENICLEKRIIDKPFNDNVNPFIPPTPNAITHETEKINLDVNNNANVLKQEEKRDAIFSQVADEIGVESKDLIRRVGKEKSLNINKIQLDNELLKNIISNDSKVGKVSNSGLEKIKKRLSVFKMKINIVESDGLMMLSLKKKNTVHDKIANTTKDVLMDMKKFINDKKEYLGIAVVSTSFLIERIKEALVNTNKKMKEKFLSAKDYINTQGSKALYNGILATDSMVQKTSQIASDMSKKTKIMYEDAINAKNDFVNDQTIKIAGRLKDASDKLYDLSKEKTNETIDSPKIKETYTYVNGKKIIVRAGTRVKAKDETQLEESFNRRIA